MKKLITKILGAVAGISLLIGCTEGNYPGGQISPYIGIYDVRTLYKGSPVDLNLESLGGSEKITAVVISDHSGNNLPSDLLIVQDKRRLDFLRGIAIPLGAAAKDYVPGDSVIININGGVLDRVDGILQIKNIGADRIEKVASNREVITTVTNTSKLIERPNDFESTMVAIVKGGFSYTPKPGQVLSGEQQINDGFGLITLNTDPKSKLANLPQYKMANYYGIVFTKLEGDSLVPYHRMRIEKDLVELKSVYKTPKVIITGWSNDPKGSDANNEYFQFIATEDIDFSKTPMSVVTSNNANASTPTGVPVNGWATGDMRTYKFNLTSGFAKKGSIFYVGGSNKLIMSTGSTSIKEANWILAYDYTKNAGFDFGKATSNLLANSGNAYGIAIFDGTTVTKESIPEDVIWVATGGSLTNNTNGYRITNNDFYDIIHPLNLKEQPFYRAGSNTNAHTYNTPADAGYFNYMGGEFNLTLGRWTKARAKYAPTLTKESKLAEIEDPLYLTKLVE